MKKHRIYFKKLIDGDYPLDVELEVFNWILKTGKPHRQYTSKWYEDGLDKCMFGYSANDHDSNTPFATGENLFKQIQCAFENAIVRTPNKPVKEWRTKERIGLDTYRILEFATGFPHLDRFEHWYLHWGIDNLQKFKGHMLKKEYFHPDYEDRLDPKILDIKLSCNGYEGYNITFRFSFSKFDYEPGWGHGFSQKKGESINNFVYRVCKEINALLVTPIKL